MNIMNFNARTFTVLTADGRIRTARQTADADSVFTVPARVSVNGRTVAGHVAALDADLFAHPGVVEPRPVMWQFTPYAYRRNADALPSWSAPVLRGDADGAPCEYGVHYGRTMTRDESVTYCARPSSWAVSLDGAIVNGSDSAITYCEYHAAMLSVGPEHAADRVSGAWVNDDWTRL